MRLLFVTWDGPQVDYLESLFIPIFRNLKLHEIHTDVLQFRWGSAARKEAARRACEEARIGYQAVAVRRWGGPVGPFVTALSGGRHIRRALRRFESDVVMPRSVLPSLALLAAGIAKSHPVLLDADGLELDERVEFGGLASMSLTYRLLRDIEAQAVRMAHAAITRTAATRDVLVARAGPPVEPAKFHIVSNGRDPDVFHAGDAATRDEVRNGLGIPPGAPLLVYVGSVGRRYRTAAIGELAIALRALRSDTRLLVLTGDPQTAARELLTPMPELEGLTTILRAPPEEVPRYLAAADVGTAFIRQSFSTRGIAPVKIGEYLLCGVPIVGTVDVGENRAAAEAGLFFDDRAGLPEAAQWIAETVLPNREELRVRSREVGLSNYSLERTTAEYIRALDGLGQGSLDRIRGDILPSKPANLA